MQELNQVVLKLSENIEQMIARLSEKENKIQELQTKLSECQTQIKELKTDNSELKQMIQHYKTVKVLSQSDNKDVKRKLNKMVREIDDCIAKLNR
ncbi:MAG TPA: hypothetical protein DIU39_02485 [Flavobacteriales bacterium]|nr:hypothetical protein [Flavobacteriales bacterium]|tara:strand:+ start:128 stop:412 length:285 start_codon:yes stop_codon:yes gene_type:complete